MWEPFLAQRSTTGEHRALSSRAQDQTDPRTDGSGVWFSRDPDLAARAARSDRWRGHVAGPPEERTSPTPGDGSQKPAALRCCPGWVACRHRGPDALGDRFGGERGTIDPRAP